MNAQQTLFEQPATPLERKRQSPDEWYGPFPDGAHYVVWRTLCVWAIRDWATTRGGAA